MSRRILFRLRLGTVGEEIKLCVFWEEVWGVTYEETAAIPPPSTQDAFEEVKSWAVVRDVFAAVAIFETDV